jgi:hypothetical protein
MGGEAAPELVQIVNDPGAEPRDRFNALTELENLKPPPKAAIPGLRKAAKDRLVGRSAAGLLSKIEAANPQ